MKQSYLVILWFVTFGMINEDADCGNLPYTRGYATQAAQAPAINYGTAARYAPITAGLPSYASPVRPSNRGYATRATFMDKGNVGIATRVNPKAQAVRVPKIKKGKKTGKKAGKAKKQ